MKLLLVDLNAEHPNAMWRNLKNSFQYEFDVVCFGPGFSTIKELELGLNYYLKVHRDIDCIVVTIPFLESAVGSDMGSVQYAYDYHRYLNSQYDVEDAVRYCTGIVDELDQLEQIPRIILAQIDFVSMKPVLVKGLARRLDKGYYYLGWGLQFTMQNLQIKTFGNSSLNMEHKKLCEKFYDKIISIPPMAITEANLFCKELKAREYDWIVPGNIVDYKQREEVQKILLEEKCNLWNQDKNRSELVYKSSKISNMLNVEYRNHFDRIIANIGKDSKTKNHYIPSRVPGTKVAAYRETFLEGLKATKFAYVDGGPANIVVAKYVEIPAAGTLMVGDMAYGLAEMGFVQGKHIVVAKPKEIKSLARNIKKELPEMQKIADRARKLVIEKHTYRERAHALKIACDRIVENTYKGSYWKDGDFRLE